MAEPIRTLVVWCPDWPVVAALRDPAAAVPSGSSDPGRPARSGAENGKRSPVAVVAGGQVYACSPVARAEGVRRGQRRRDAQARCPELLVVAHDPARDVRIFEPVVDALDALAPGVAVLTPGTCAVAARGPAGYFGGEAAIAERIVDQLAGLCDVDAQVGVADGIFAAGLAARAGVLVEPGRTARFLAGLDVRVLGRPELVGLLRRLGIRTLGAFAALPAGDVLARFGFDAAVAHRLAGGAERGGLTPRTVPPDLTVVEEFDPPVDRVDAAAFTARALAERLHERLLRRGLAGTRLIIEAVTGHGAEHRRTWGHDGMLRAADVADRVRWQLEGWLTGPDRPTAGIVLLRLIPDGIVEHAGLQPRLWGEADAGTGVARRSVTHVQGLLGPDGILAPVLGGGRAPADRVRWVAWGDERTPARPVEPPWPGQLPVPAPAAVPTGPVAEGRAGPPLGTPAVVLAADGTPVGVTGRHVITAAPAVVSVAGAAPVEVRKWAGPWPAEERWWAPTSRRLARIQVALVDGRALLLALTAGTWQVEASYD